MKSPVTFSLSALAKKSTRKFPSGCGKSNEHKFRKVFGDFGLNKHFVRKSIESRANIIHKSFRTYP